MQKFSAWEKATFLKHLIKTQALMSEWKWDVLWSVSVPDDSRQHTWQISKPTTPLLEAWAHLYSRQRDWELLKRSWGQFKRLTFWAVNFCPVSFHQEPTHLNRVQHFWEGGLTPRVKNVGKAPERFSQLLQATQALCPVFKKWQRRGLTLAAW